MPLPSSQGERRRPSGPFRMLVVCTGNVCRSPLAAAALRRGLATDAVEVASAGLGAQEGAPVDAAVRAEARRLGLDVDAHRAHLLRAEDAAASDLVIVATRRQRSVVVDLVPAAIQRTFTLLELDAALARVDAAELPGDGGAVARLAATVRAAARARGPAVRGVDVDVPDPHGGSAALHRAVADLVEAAASRIAARVGTLARIHPPDEGEDVS
ncbi:MULTISPECIES: low molecular weight phosphatase family protein [unclassified Agrococcus]|uniref:arsenate reductase/protein-tyrosine-phosphatase family protein n=1 Tax=unclassified Agrococcus TaxID=2615065 RepID=UPI0036240E18